MDLICGILFPSGFKPAPNLPDLTRFSLRGRNLAAVGSIDDVLLNFEYYKLFCLTQGQRECRQVMPDD